MGAAQQSIYGEYLLQQGSIKGCQDHKPMHEGALQRRVDDH
jgi:hypothetical protein